MVGHKKVYFMCIERSIEDIRILNRNNSLDWLEPVRFSLFWGFGSIWTSVKENEWSGYWKSSIQNTHTCFHCIFRWKIFCIHKEQSRSFHEIHVDFVTNEIFIFILLFKDINYVTAECARSTGIGALCIVMHIWYISSKTNACQTFQGCHLNKPKI